MHSLFFRSDKPGRDTPGINGITFLKKILSGGISIPFIIFTGKGREDVVIGAINSSVDYYIRKEGDPAVQFAGLAHISVVLSGRGRRTVQSGRAGGAAGT